MVFTLLVNSTETLLANTQMYKQPQSRTAPTFPFPLTLSPLTCFWRFAFILICLLMFSEVPIASIPVDGPTVLTSSGLLQGAPRSSGGAEFLGVPYAQPPVGDLRWHEPLPVKPWTGVRPANTFSATCAQPVLGDWNRHDAEVSSEDCLYLNVMVPSWPVKSPLPVMFWIHGGANAGGTAMSPLYKDGTLLQHGVILVTVNYRLGVFGFLSHPELTNESAHHASGNYGLIDQAAALFWVHENISNFGGDPNNITVFGQSAGAQDTGMLMTSPLSKDLFRRAIQQSGSPLNPPLPALSDSEKSGLKLAAALKAPTDSGGIAFLRHLSKEELIKGAGAAQDPAQLPLFGPNQDGWLIRRSPREVLAAGKGSSIPLMIGTTTREFGMSAPLPVIRKMIQNVTGSLSDRVLAIYSLAGEGQGTTDPQYGPVGDQWFADLAFRCPSTTQAAWHTAAHQPVYEYEFEHAIPGQESQGAVHSADLPYVFGFFPRTGNISGAFNETDFKLAELMETYWTNFAKSGNPNAAGLPTWPEFGTSQSYIKFTQEGKVINNAHGLRQVQCDTFRAILK